MTFKSKTTEIIFFLIQKTTTQLFRRIDENKRLNGLAREAHFEKVKAAKAAGALPPAPEYYMEYDEVGRL